jgi:hypothetical protein
VTSAELLTQTYRGLETAFDLSLHVGIRHGWEVNFHVPIVFLSGKESPYLLDRKTGGPRLWSEKRSAEKISVRYWESKNFSPVVQAIPYLYA